MAELGSICTVNEYRDVGPYDDELAIVLSLKHARSLATVLELDLGSLFGVDTQQQVTTGTSRRGSFETRCCNK